MTLEELLYGKITNDAAMQDKLAKFRGRPALFERLAPNDKDPGWGGKAEYPRIDYVVDRSEDPERKTEGTVAFNIWCLTTSAFGPEEVERRLRELVDGAVFHPSDSAVTAVKWSRTDPFESEDALAIGLTVTFDLLAFPSQLTTSPDPVAAMNEWTKTVFPDLQVDPESWAPTDQIPAVYWRLAGFQVTDQHAAVDWLNATVAGHVLAPTPAGRLPWLKRIVEHLARTRRITMDDGSPMLLLNIAADSLADQFRAGQLRVTARYGVLVPSPAVQPLNNPTMTGT